MLAGIDLSLGSVRKDFGRGFYLTERLQGASNRAHAKAKEAGTSPAVLSYQVDRNAFTELDTIIFWQPTPDFWDFVRQFRTRHIMSDMRGPGISNYDVAFGPVTMLPGVTAVMQDYDQYCFRSRRAVDLLANPTPVPPLPRRLIPTRTDFP